MTDLENTERNWLLALIDLSTGDLEAKTRLKKYWLDLENYPEWHGRALLLKTGALCEQILTKHPDWGTLTEKVV